MNFACAATVEQQLQEAEDYLTINPSQTLKLLNKMGKPHTLKAPNQIRWHLLAMRASVPTGKMDILIDSLESVFHHYQHPYFTYRLTTITSGLGIWLRKNNYPIDAQISLECSYKYARNEKQRLTITNSLALIARQLNDLSKAKALYADAMQLAVRAERTNILAIIENNLGLIAFEEGNIKQAESHFRAALKGYQAVDKRSGQISAGINLLFIFIVQEELVNFSRLYQPTQNLTRSFPNISKQALLFWLHSTYLKMLGEPERPNEKEKLRGAYLNIADEKVQKLVKKHLAGSLAVNLPETPESVPKRFNRPWFEHVKRCDWLQ